MEITLLDGVSWDRDTLLEAMLDDDFYYGYLGKASLSSSACKALNDSPRVYELQANGQQLETSALSVGKLIHTAVLEPEKVETSFDIVSVSTKTTKAYKEAKDNLEKGKTLLTVREYDDAMRVVDAVLSSKVVKSFLQGSSYEKPEIGMINDIPFRAKADILRENEAVFDLKTTSDISGFNYSARKYGYPAQVFIYCTLFNVPFSEFKFIVVDKGSKDIGIFSVSESFYNEGQRLVLNAIGIYTSYFINGEDIRNYVIYGEL